MHDILKKQNDSENINFLRASASAYQKAKNGEIKISYFLIFLSIAYPLTYIFLKDETTKLILFGCSFGITILIQIFSGTFKGYTSKGAIFKEEFDISIFGLPWISTVKKPYYSEVSYFSNQYRGNIIKDWYSVNLSPTVSVNTAVAVFQHSNASWDIEIRKTYRKWLISYVVFYSIILLVLLYINNIDGLTIFLLLFSLLSFYIHFITLIRGHSSAIKKRESISKRLDEIIQNKKYINTDELRDIQDVIYITSQEASKVPNFFLRWFKLKLVTETEDYIKNVNTIYRQT